MKKNPHALELLQAGTDENGDPDVDGGVARQDVDSRLERERSDGFSTHMSVELASAFFAWHAKTARSNRGEGTGRIDVALEPERLS